jgi:RNA polymerase sigma factor (sigma-70 family)
MSAATAPAIDRNKLVMDNLGLAKCIALSRMPRSLFVTGECEDAIQEAMLGLVQAAQRHDPSKSAIKFATYARYRIYGQFKDYLRHKSLVGIMRCDGDRSLQQAEHRVDPLGDKDVPQSQQYNPASDRFEDLMDLVSRCCTARTTAMVRLWCEGATQEYISRVYGISPVRVCQILSAAFRATRSASKASSGTKGKRMGEAAWSYSLNSKSELGLSQTLFKLIQSFPQLSLYLSEDGYCTFRAWKDGKPINPPVWEAFIRGYPPVALTPELESIFIGWQKLFDEQE